MAKYLIFTLFCFFLHKKKRAIGLNINVGNAQHPNDSKNVISTFWYGSHCSLVFMSIYLKYAAQIGPSQQLLRSMVELHNLRRRRVCFPYSHSMEGRFAFTSHGNLSRSHKQHADTPKQGLHSPPVFLNLDESQSHWHCLKRAHRCFGFLRPGLRG